MTKTTEILLRKACMIPSLDRENPINSVCVIALYMNLSVGYVIFVDVTGIARPLFRSRSLREANTHLMFDSM